MKKENAPPLGIVTIDIPLWQQFKNKKRKRFLDRLCVPNSLSDFFVAVGLQRCSIKIDDCYIFFDNCLTFLFFNRV